MLVRADVVLEVAVDVARDAGGRWRHPVRVHRAPVDTGIDDVPLFDDTGDRPVSIFSVATDRVTGAA
ncbi:hypothetical protein [Streptomyces sp. NPDC008150]|uniref:hypothetical protein n=1 Tax=Streptomyces sp. NPDC008150 TaxID=3364816 RepID=UPI0036E9FF96